jgi:hypothetical protein
VTIECPIRVLTGFIAPKRPEPGNTGIARNPTEARKN